MVMLSCFNEAAGYYRRNRGKPALQLRRIHRRFNEAAGYYRRNPGTLPEDNKPTGVELQ